MLPISLRPASPRCADADPECCGRAYLCRDFDERLDNELRADPDADLSLAEVIIAIGNDLGLSVNLSKLPNKFLELPPTRRPTGPVPSTEISPAAWLSTRPH